MNNWAVFFIGVLVGWLVPNLILMLYRRIEFRRQEKEIADWMKNT